MTITPVDTRGIDASVAVTSITIGESDPADGTAVLGTILSDLASAFIAVREAGNSVAVEEAISALNVLANLSRQLHMVAAP